MTKSQGGILRVLIADDEAIIRMGLKRMLEEMGHQVVGVAADGIRAVELAHQTQPDLAILDIKMPEMDGLAAAEAIAAKRPLPILILTAASTTAAVASAARYGRWPRNSCGIRVPFAGASISPLLGFTRG